MAPIELPHPSESIPQSGAQQIPRGERPVLTKFASLLDGDALQVRLWLRLLESSQAYDLQCKNQYFSPFSHISPEVGT